jgi:hypothetical protein
MVRYTLISFEVLFSFMPTRKLINRLCPQSILLSDLPRVDLFHGTGAARSDMSPTPGESEHLRDTNGSTETVR